MVSRLLLMGGHEFDRLDGNEVLCDLILELAGTASPRVCLLPTASGDPDDQISRFRRSFGSRGAEATDLSLFRLGDSPVDLETYFLAQDVIYIGGGSLLNLVAVWGAHGIFELLREALEAGVLVCGQSAGAMCWFERGITTSSGTPVMADGLGLLPGSLCVHYHRDPERRATFLTEIAAGAPSGYGADDQTALLFEDGEVTRAVSARAGAGIWKVTGGQDGKATELSLEVEDIGRSEVSSGPASSIDDFRELNRWRTGPGIGRGR
ncbi:MAG: peptidase E [Solirubrobacterales bacterium]